MYIYYLAPIPVRHEVGENGIQDLIVYEVGVRMNWEEEG